MATMSPSTIAHYRIVSRLGAGGMGEVFLAHDTKLDRKVAIKILNETFGRDDDKVNRFVREARAASALNHPNILTVYEIGDVGGRHYIATELIDGMTLREHLARGGLPRHSVVAIGVQVAEALAAAHQAGIIHRDIKPENIMLRRDGYAKVLDFGLAKLSEPAATAPGSGQSEEATRFQATSPGVVMGTVAYMSPEQARGATTDARSDLWSLGVVLYEMLAGRAPFGGDTSSHTIVSILEREPVALAHVPTELHRIVRKALAKDADMRYQSARDMLIDLKTLRRDLDAESGAAPPVESPDFRVAPAGRRRLVTLAGTIVLTVGVAAAGYFAFASLGDPARIGSIAVLPFQNSSGNSDSEYLSDGLAESLIYRLSQLPDLKVSPTSSVLRYKNTDTDPQRIASELGVQAVLSGRMVQRGDHLTISVELIDAGSNRVLWGEQYERPMSELLATQREIAGVIAGKLQVKLAAGATTAIDKKYTSSNEAYQLYLRGRFNWNKRTGDGLQAAVQFYNQAIDKDPGFALAYAGLADTYVIIGAYGNLLPGESMPRAKAAALRAVELDGTLAEPHAALGAYYGAYAWNFDAAERALRRAIELNPGYATAWHWLGNFLPIIGKGDEAIAAGKRAEELDPLSAIISADTGWDLIILRRYDEAIEQAQRTLLIDPNFWYAHCIIGLASDLKGLHAEAVRAFQKAAALNPDVITTGRLAAALARAGDRVQAQRLLAGLHAEAGRRYIQGYYLATAELALGDTNAALTSLERDARERGIYMQWLAINPEFDGLRAEKRFAAILERMKASRLE
jgi:serine/threonine protein kinase/tetratricopeptide (TPR) repeat protein